jgi:hypothetical protein
MPHKSGDLGYKSRPGHVNPNKKRKTKKSKSRKDKKKYG